MSGLKDKTVQEKKDYVSDIYEKYRKEMIHVAMKYLHNIDDAEDAVQDVFVKVLINIDNLPYPDSIRTRAYLCVAAQNVAINMAKSPERKNISLDALDIEIPNTYSMEAEIEDKLEVEYLTDLIYTLEEKHKSVLVLKYVNNFSIAQIAEALDINYFTAAKRIKQAEKALHEKYEKEGGGK